MKRCGKFYGVGLGPGDPELLTRKAERCLRQADRIFTVASRQSGRSVSGGIIDSLSGLKAQVTELEFVMVPDWAARLERIGRHADLIAAELRAGRECAFATIGDPMTYSTCGYLLRTLRRRLPELESEIIPGVNSWSALAARLQQPLAEDSEELRILPGMADDRMLEEAAAGTGTTVLLKTYRRRNEILEKFRLRPDLQICYGADLGLEGEFFSDDPEEILKRPEEYLSILALSPRRNGGAHD